MSEMKMEVHDVTPEMAREWLALNVNNRRLRTAWCRVLAARMRAEQWRCSHQGIAFNESGKLCDGQHRLAAVVESGVTCRMAVFRNVPDDAFRVLDQGAKRSFEDLSGLDKRIVAPLSYAASLVFANQASFEDFEAILKTPTADAAFDLISYCGTTARTFSAAAVKLAAAMTAQVSKSHHDHAFETYRALVLQDFDAMPRVAHSLVRQIMQGSVSSTGRGKADELFARAMIVFDPERASISRVQCDAETVKKTRRDAARILREQLHDQGRRIAVDEGEE